MIYNSTTPPHTTVTTTPPKTTAATTPKTTTTIAPSSGAGGSKPTRGPGCFSACHAEKGTATCDKECGTVGGYDPNAPHVVTDKQKSCAQDCQDGGKGKQVCNDACGITTPAPVAPAVYYNPCYSACVGTKESKKCDTECGTVNGTAPTVSKGSACYEDCRNVKGKGNAICDQSCGTTRGVAPVMVSASSGGACSGGYSAGAVAIGPGDVTKQCDSDGKWKDCPGCLITEVPVYLQNKDAYKAKYVTDPAEAKIFDNEFGACQTTSKDIASCQQKAIDAITQTRFQTAYEAYAKTDAMCAAQGGCPYRTSDTLPSVTGLSQYQLSQIPKQMHMSEYADAYDKYTTCLSGGYSPGACSTEQKAMETAFTASKMTLDQRDELIASVIQTQNVNKYSEAYDKYTTCLSGGYSPGACSTEQKAMETAFAASKMTLDQRDELITKVIQTRNVNKYADAYAKYTTCLSGGYSPGACAAEQKAMETAFVESGMSLEQRNKQIAYVTQVLAHDKEIASLTTKYIEAGMKNSECQKSQARDGRVGGGCGTYADQQAAILNNPLLSADEKKNIQDSLHKAIKTNEDYKKYLAAALSDDELKKQCPSCATDAQKKAYLEKLVAELPPELRTDAGAKVKDIKATPQYAASVNAEKVTDNYKSKYDEFIKTPEGKGVTYEQFAAKQNEIMNAEYWKWNSSGILKNENVVKGLADGTILPSELKANYETAPWWARAYANVAGSMDWMTNGGVTKGLAQAQAYTTDGHPWSAAFQVAGTTLSLAASPLTKTVGFVVGDVVINGAGKAIFGRNDDTWKYSDVWLPTKEKSSTNYYMQEVLGKPTTELVYRR